MLGLATLILLTITDGVSSIASINVGGIVAVANALICSQYDFFHLYKIYSTQKATVFTLLRAPWGVALEAMFLGSGVGVMKIISCVIVFAGAIIAIPKSAEK